jgi:hypothetical protein
MQTIARTCLVIFALQHAASCVALTSEPWSRFRAGAATVEIAAGGSQHEAEVEIEGETGSLAGVLGSETEKLKSEYLIGARGQKFVTDSWSVGGGLEWWRHKSATFDFGDFSFRNRPFGYLRYLLSSRYLFPAPGWGRLERVRPFAGAEVFYVSDLDVDIDVEYDADPSANEEVEFEGHGYYGYDLGAGLAFLAADDTLVELGCRWTQNFSPSDDIVELDPPGGSPSRVATDIDLGGWSLYVALTYSF